MLSVCSLSASSQNCVQHRLHRFFTFYIPSWPGHLDLKPSSAWVRASPVRHSISANRVYRMRLQIFSTSLSSDRVSTKSASHAIWKFMVRWLVLVTLQFLGWETKSQWFVMWLVLWLWSEYASPCPHKGKKRALWNLKKKKRPFLFLFTKFWTGILATTLITYC